MTFIDFHSPVHSDEADQNDTFDPRSVVWVESLSSIRALKEHLRLAGLASFDTETTGLDEYATTGGDRNGGVAARIAMATFTVPVPGEFNAEPTNYVVPLSHPQGPFVGSWRSTLADILEHCLDHKVGLIAQNGKFDSRWCYAATDIDISGNLVWDTMLSSGLLDENENKSLKPRAAKTFGIEQWDDGIDFSKPGEAERIDYHYLGLYAVRDTYWTWKLARHHILSMTTFEIDGQPTEEEIVLSGLYRLMTELVQPTFRTITKVEQRGIYLDPEGVQREIEEQEKIIRELEPEIVHAYPVEEEYGSPSLEPVSKWFKRWAELAVEAGEFVVIETTPSGHPSWGAAVLKKLQRVHGSELAGKLLDLRAAKKKLQFLKAWLGKVSRHGKIHASYNVGRTVTGRLSSSDPNMQQVTRSLKPAFSPSPGYYLAEIDYSQIELRVAAHISGSKAMIEAYRAGQDLHKMIAARTARISVDEVTKEQRQAGKAANFGLIYGMSAEGFQNYAEAAYGVEMTLEEATKFREEFFKLWDGLIDWHHRMIDEAAATGQVISPLGRVRRLPDIRSSWVGARSDAERQAINSPVQGMASDMMMLAASAISGEIKDVRGIPEVRMVGTVHDSILVEVPQEGWEFWTREVMGYMTEEVPRLLDERFGVKLAVPLECEATVGSRWGLDDVGTLE